MRFKLMLAAAAMMVAAPVAMAQENTQTPGAARAVQGHVDAYRSGNLERYVRSFAPNAVVTMNGVVLANGHAEIRALYRLNFAEGAPKIRIDDSGVNRDRVYLSVAYVFADGSEQCCSYSEYLVSGGKITRLDTQG
ncbi:nuclear transport factor 2 family protein [Erythrobacter crassostreae]|uniref:Nuclear transport factor 2 family protein n=1 Tax=Erythrobacter crassostreae TaxID=2828328 RepID=A0A9X1F4Y6_9SPHN|nr:nuclear transport factor 2 family protein [Erythrobacter crassostrea]MBV7259588.1 nuclear transport factor 2 family protein [Erythrobacter crassostrea]